LILPENRGEDPPLPLVIAGLDPAIHQSSNHPSDKMDARVKPAHDEEEWPGDSNREVKTGASPRACPAGFLHSHVHE
jgi:peptide/nickel transport system ATP-binding protein